jgi:2,5-diketo-D-gluconate reductase A
MTVPTVSLNSQHQIPQLGFGVFQIDPSDTVEAVLNAFEVGYRHIDTAQMYGNEHEVGQAIRQSGLPRDEIFVTSKLNNNNHEPESVKNSFAKSLELLGLDRMDLFLIHWPLPSRFGGDFVSTWQAMAELAAGGQASSVGVSNFQPDHLRRIVDETGVVPAINQIEVHPYFTNEAAREANAKLGIATEAWSPIAQGGVLDDPTISEIAEKHGKSTAQVTLRWHVERGDIIFPKSVTPERIKANFEIFDFRLTPDEVSAISALDKGEDGRTGPNPDVFDYVPE